ncbi:hypothetical protein CV016_20150 [Yersinia kristensenii]|uniref:hypothetical protein n=1 Tax=Yersinia kristensenii TaxID=28152 RepID=UPI000C228CDF|nr:hypothetical protein [Yersinia kristensenii]PJG60961.1 hypothetical protein CV016_20150 [Yersinia kristensenii]
MASITDFEAWLDNVDDETEEVMALYRAVSDVEDMGLYKCEPGNRQDTWIVSSNHHAEDLFLASSTAKSAFLHAIHERFVGDDEMDMESWYGYRLAMENDRS